MISVIIPVYNEGRDLERTLSGLQAQRRQSCVPVEIIVVDGHPRQTTIRRLDGDGMILRRSQAGRGAQMNCGVAAASGEILLFLHADTRLSEGALERIQRCLRPETGVVAGAFGLGIDSRRTAYRFIEFGARLRTRLTQIPYGDQAIFIKRADFLRLGGFLCLPIMEDVELMQRVKRAGGRIRILRSRVYTSARRWESEGIIFGTLRNWSLVILYWLGVAPQRLVRWYDTDAE
jgi:rSAM/selenodomain-associated transferase 2